jgi:hypothetical protein
MESVISGLLSKYVNFPILNMDPPNTTYTYVHMYVCNKYMDRSTWYLQNQK